MRIFHSVVLVALLGLPVAIADAPKEEMVKQETQKLLGKWQVTKWVSDGEAAPAAEVKDFTFEFKDKSVTMRMDKEDEGTRFEFKLDPSKKPKWMDLDWGPEAGLGIMGAIYELDGDALKICTIDDPAKGKAGPRPTEFKSKAEKEVLYELKRIKK